MQEPLCVHVEDDSAHPDLVLRCSGLMEPLHCPPVLVLLHGVCVEETEVASHQEGPAVPGGTRLEEETSSTEPETGSAPTRMYSPPLPSWRGLPAGFLCPEQPDPGPAVGWAAPSVLTSCPGAFGRRPHSPRDSGPPARACPDTQPDQTLVLCCAA